MNRLDEAITAHADLQMQLQKLESVIWSELQQIAPELVELIRQTGMAEPQAITWISRSNQQLSSLSPAQCIATGRIDLVTAMVVRSLHGIW